uniref:Reverse transcriptase Ty1/copia-type domain-containing protein n=1 Tax=Tanacetum cinerariifolium TaxID=118510 RepID=A0A6L2J4A1_TANCI|nr:hypothetical protein [Tanacetum cinerariifolium]
MFVIEQPIPPAPATDFEANVLAEWNAIYDAYNEVACLMLGKEGKPVSAYVLKIKAYVEQLERLGYVLPHDLSVGLFLNGLTSDFAGFVRNYNMHKIGKTIGEIHALLIEYEKCLPNKAEIPQVMMIKSGKILKANKKSLKAKDKGKANGKRKDKQVFIPKPKNPKPTAKEHPAKDDTCHHYKEMCQWKRNCPVYLAKLLKKYKQVGTASSSGKMTRKSFPHRPERATDLLEIIYTDVCDPLRHVSRQGVYVLKACGIVQHLTYPYTPQHNGDYALESATRILNMVSTKKVDKTPYELWYGKVPNLCYLKVWGCEALVKQDTPDKLQQRSVKYAEFFKKSLITQEVSGRAIGLEEIQDEDTSPFEIASEIPMEVEGFKPPQEEVIPIRRSERTHRASNRLCLNIEAEERSLGDLNEPTSYKSAMLKLESNKWLDAMNAKMQSMINNNVWVLVDLPPKCKTVGTKGCTQLYEVDYKKTFSPFADFRAIRIIISIATFYDYEIWKMDVKTAFLNGYLDEDIYMVQPEGLGEATFIFGIKIYRDRSKRLIRLSQSAYMDKILKRYKMDNSKRGHIPIQERLELNKTQGDSTPEEVKRMKNVPYALAMGSIMRDGLEKISKQSTTVMSATKAEYIAISEATMEAVWIRKFISGLGIVPIINKPIKMFCDNSVVLLIDNEPGVQRGAKHYHRRYHFVCGCIELGEINLLKVHTDDNVDPFTKALPKGKLTQHVRSVILCLASSFM